ncbi:MAG TPA: FAD-binding protein [Candidatus Acidoferrum sp.]|nr:FAD-binding protein [Candidatus Acidoferrum sp.]
MKRVLSLVLGVLLMLGAVTGCQQTPVAQPEPPPPSYTAGTYEATAQGMNGPVPVSVTVSADKIEAVTVGENVETLGLGDIAAKKLPGRIVEKQSLAVDVVSGATITSYAILSAAETALTQAGADVAKLKEKPAEEPLEAGAAETVDIVIVGAGLSGIMASYDLKEKYPDVSYVTLEQMDVIMGSLPMAGGAIIAPKSTLHTADGLESSIDDIIQLMEVASDGPVRNQYITNIYSNAEELLNRLIGWGAPLGSPTLSKEAANKNVYAYWADGRGAGFAKFFNEHVENNPINLRLRSKVTELIVTDGKVTGVKVQDDEKTYEIHAKAVLLATGGFGMNKDLIAKYEPMYVGGLSRTNAGATGDGFKFAEQFGTEIVGYGMMGGGVRASMALGSIASNFIVSTEGKRIANETDANAVLAALNGGKVTGYKLVDGKFADKDGLQARVDAGLIKPYDTLEALAQGTGIDEASLLATVAAYNAAVDAGTNPEFGLPVDKATKIDTAPFYAEKLITGWFGTVPGLEVDDYMRVLDSDNEPVPGLYAAGELTEGNFWRRTYPGAGVGISYATYTGPYAVRVIVDDFN